MIPLSCSQCPEWLTTKWGHKLETVPFYVLRSCCYSTSTPDMTAYSKACTRGLSSKVSKAKHDKDLYAPEANCEAYTDCPSVSEGNAPSVSTSKERNVHSFSGASQKALGLDLRTVLFKQYRFFNSRIAVFLNRQMLVPGDILGS